MLRTSIRKWAVVGFGLGLIIAILVKLYVWVHWGRPFFGPVFAVLDVLTVGLTGAFIASAAAGMLALLWASVDAVRQRRKGAGQNAGHRQNDVRK